MSYMKVHHLKKYASLVSSTECRNTFSQACFFILLQSYFVYYVGCTFWATVGFQDSGIFQKAIKQALRCIQSVNSQLSGFRL